MQTLQKHQDGEWWTSEHNYLGHKLLIKMSANRGCKVHIFPIIGTKVLKTFRMNFATEAYLLKRSKNWIDENNRQKT